MFKYIYRNISDRRTDVLYWLLEKGLGYKTREFPLDYFAGQLACIDV